MKGFKIKCQNQAQEIYKFKQMLSRYEAQIQDLQSQLVEADKPAPKSVFVEKEPESSAKVSEPSQHTFGQDTDREE